MTATGHGLNTQAQLPPQGARVAIDVVLAVVLITEKQGKGEIFHSVSLGPIVSGTYFADSWCP